MHYLLKTFLCCCLYIFPNNLYAIAAGNQTEVTQQKEQQTYAQKIKKKRKTPISPKERAVRRLARASVIFGGLSFIIPPLSFIGLILARIVRKILHNYEGEEPEGVRDLANRGRLLSLGGLVIIGLVITGLIIGMGISFSDGFG